ncbi:aminoglycoside phosphotransferase family protein [Pseudomonas sp. 39004]|uniref:phosphotransferase n=1 Tax=Pseudomonas TaxID=286 RepID=UPI0009BE715C|nr:MULTISPECIES: phosphotransferase [Pseudomonas]MDD1960075.1 aminoglycoside phosphotransferase family protein [Pseudomonas sp. 39004]NWA68551.1 phosphotransferase [Pseudomonas reactans]
MDELETILQGGGRSLVTKKGDVVFRAPTPWSMTTVALLEHLERVGFEYSPRLVGTGLDSKGREMVSFLDGDFVHPKPWEDEALPLLGRILRELHLATNTFVPPDNAQWRPWFGRGLGTPSVIGHCDTGPWNIVCRNQLPFALIDWEEAGPVDPLIELAQACWLNAQLVDDDIAEKQGLPSIEVRAHQMRLLLDGYGVPRSQRAGFIDKVRDFAIFSAANEAIAARVTMDSQEIDPLWGISWRARSAAWIIKHQATLNRAIVR